MHSRLLGRSVKRMHAMHFMVNAETHRLAATSETLNAYIDMRVRKMAAIADEAAHVLDNLIAEHQSLAWSAPVCGVIFP